MAFTLTPKMAAMLKGRPAVSKTTKEWELLIPDASEVWLDLQMRQNRLQGGGRRIPEGLDEDSDSSKQGLVLSNTLFVYK